MIEVLLSLTNNNPNRYVTHYAHYYSSITYLSYLSPFRFSLPSLWYLFSLHYMKKEARPSTGDYTSTFDHQITTFILAKTIRFRVQQFSLTTYLIFCYFQFFPQMSSFSAMMCRLSVKLIFIFILYLIIAYFNQFSLLLSELTPSAEHSVLFDNYHTSLLWDSLEILYSPLRRTNIIQNTT